MFIARLTRQNEADLVPIDDPSYTTYEALSYQWGDVEKKPRAISVNGQKLWITANLWQALIYLRRVGQSRTLWIDAICINQNDVDERSHQVAMMAEIYTNASKVVSWLGAENRIILSNALKFLLRIREDSLKDDEEVKSMLKLEFPRTAIRHYVDHHYNTTLDDQDTVKNIAKRPLPPKIASQDLKEAKEEVKLTQAQASVLAILSKHDHKRRSEYMDRQSRAKPWDSGSRMCVIREKGVLKNAFVSGAEHEIVQIMWKNLRKFCKLQYWSRLWVVQEVILARNLTLQSMDITMEWHTFSDLFLCLKYVSANKLQRAPHITSLLLTPITKLVQLRRDYKVQISTPQYPPGVAQDPAYQNSSVSFKGLELPQIILSCVHTLCWDPRDRIYGLLGLATGTGLEVYPDYRRTASEVYEELMKKTGLWRNDQLFWFSSLIQQQLGGLPLEFLRSTTSSTNTSHGQIFKTRAKVDGSINVLGDSFTTISDAKKLIESWQELYFHRILSHEPASNPSVTVQNCLNRMGHDYKRAFGVQSKQSHAKYVTLEKKVPWNKWDPNTWDQVQQRHSKYRMDKSSVECELCSATQRTTKDIANINQLTEIQQEPIINETMTGIEFVESEDPLSSATQSTLTNTQSESTDPDDSHIYEDPTHDHAQPRWIIGTRGQIGLVPATAKEGDAICHFQGSDVAVIVRRSSEASDYCSIVGSALMLKRWGEEDVPIHEGAKEFFPYSVGQRGKLLGMEDDMAEGVEFHLDFHTLRLLTYKPSL